MMARDNTLRLLPLLHPLGAAMNSLLISGLVDRLTATMQR